MIKDFLKLKWLILFILLYMLGTKTGLYRFCPLKQLTGFPCPGCGVTRGLTHIALLDFEAAFRFNPSAFLWAGYLLYCFIFRYIVNGKKIHRPDIKLANYGVPHYKEIFMVLFGIMVAIYIYRMVMYFPAISPRIDTSNMSLDTPIVFHNKNTLGTIFPGYNDLICKIFDS